MLSAESRRGRRIVARLDRGEDFVSSVIGLCKERGVTAAELRALGSFETVEVAEYDQAARHWKPGRKLGGGLELLALTGNVSQRGEQLAFHAHVTLMRDTDNGVVIFGGHLNAARVFAVELVVETLDDLALVRDHDAATGLALWRSLSERAVDPPVTLAITAPPASSGPPASPTWRDVAAASAKPAAAEADEPDCLLAAGDLLIHPTFGRCEVQRIEGGNEFAHVRLRNGRLVRLALDVVKIVAGGTEQGRRVFRARMDG